MKHRVDEAIRYARLWRDGKLIGGDPYEVCAALLGEIERLNGCAPPFDEIAAAYNQVFDDDLIGASATNRNRVQRFVALLFK